MPKPDERDFANVISVVLCRQILSNRQDWTWKRREVTWISIAYQSRTKASWARLSAPQPLTVPFFPDWEFHTLFGLERGKVRAIAGRVAKTSRLPLKK